MAPKAVSFSTYPTSVTFDYEGGYMEHTSDGMRIDVPSYAVSAGDSVVITIDKPNLDAALPATTPGDTFTKVGPHGTTNYGAKVTALKSGADYQFTKNITIRFAYSDLPTGAETVETNGAVDPSNWHPRDGSPWNETITVTRAYVTLATAKVGRPYSGSTPSIYFVVGNK